jgi:hypothetical protein
MNFLFPIFKLRLLPAMLGIAVMGGMVGGSYGVLHDQITYSLGPEYFTKLKFSQFHYANFGFPVRMYVAEIGFLAMWWVGFFAAWFLARIAVPAWPFRVAVKRSLSAFLIIFCAALGAGLVGYVLGLRHTADYSRWMDLCQMLGVTDIPGFVRVAYIHNASYLGGLVGLVVAIVYLQRRKNAEAAIPRDR